MIRLQNIEKVYRTERIETVALSDVNIEVGEGAIRGQILTCRIFQDLTPFSGRGWRVSSLQSAS